MNSQPTFLFLTYLNTMNYGHIIKSMLIGNFTPVSGGEDISEVPGCHLLRQMSS